MATVGFLNALLGADTGQLGRDMGKAVKIMNSSGARMNRALAKVDRGFGRLKKGAMKLLKGLNPLGILAGGFLAGGLALLVKRSIAAGDAIAKTADKVGVGVEALQKFRYAAELAGVGVTTADMALQRFSRRIGEVAQGQGELLGVAKQYGVQLRDGTGKMRANIDIMKDFADVIQNAESKQEQLRISFKLFDSEGAALVNLMREGGDGMQKMMDQADRLGFVLSEKMVRASVKANDQLTIMSKSIGVNLTRLMIGLAPTIVRVGEAFAAAAPKIKEFIDGFLPLSLRSSDMLRREITALQDELRGLYDGGADDFSLAFGDGNLLGGDGKQAGVLVERINELKTALSAAEQAEAAIKAAMGGTSINISPDATSVSTRNLARLNKQKKDLIEAYRQGGDAVDAFRQKMDLENTAYAQNIDLTFAKGKAWSAAYQEGQNMERQIATITSLSDELGSAFSRAMQKFVTEGGKAKDVLRGLVAEIQAAFFRRTVGSAIDSIMGSVVSAAAGSFFGGGTSAAPTSNLVDVHRFATGGTGMVGGSGGTDSQLVSFWATPGEQVNVLTPGQQRRTGGGGGNVFNVDMRGASVEAVARLEALVREVNGSIEARAVGAVAEANARDPNLLRAA